MATKNKLEENISEYTFTNFSNTQNVIVDDVEDYKFSDFSKMNVIDKKKHSEIIKIERTHASNTGFQISPVVGHFRGLKTQEKEELEEKINHEIAIRLDKIKDQAYQDGFQKGKEEGTQEIYNEMKSEIDEKLSMITGLISETLSYKTDLLKEEKKKLYHLIRNLSKWIILDELNNDNNYLNRLFEKLITELDTKSNLLIQVNKKSFEKMPDVLKIVEKKLGKLENIRLEVDYDLQGPGIILSSKNSLIDGTLLEQFNSLDKLFHTVGLDVSDENLAILENKITNDSDINNDSKDNKDNKDIKDINDKEDSDE